MIHVGIDPGTQTGFAWWNETSGEFVCRTTDFWGVIDTMTHDVFFSRPVTIVHIEVPSSKTLFAGRNKRLGAAGDVGAVVRESQLLAEGIRRLGYKVIEHTPAEKGKKLDAETFRRLTGYSGRTNQHERDAGMLCWRANKR